DEQAAGSTVWSDIAGGRGVGLVVGSIRHSTPSGRHAHTDRRAYTDTGHRPRLADRPHDTGRAPTRGDREASLRGPRLAPVTQPSTRRRRNGRDERNLEVGY